MGMGPHLMPRESGGFYGWPAALEKDERQPEREPPAHDDDGDEAHRAEGLALNVGHAEQEADAVVHLEEEAGEGD